MKPHELKAKLSNIPISLWIVIFTVGFAVSVFCWRSAELVWAISRLLIGTTEPPTPYTSHTVFEVCALLKIGDDDPFCAYPNEQSALTLKLALYRNYPIEVTKYYDLLPLLETRPSHSNKPNQRFVPGGCPSPREGEHFCYVIFPGEVNVVTIEFDQHGSVVWYDVMGDDYVRSVSD